MVGVLLLRLFLLSNSGQRSRDVNLKVRIIKCGAIMLLQQTASAVVILSVVLRSSGQDSSRETPKKELCACVSKTKCAVLLDYIGADRRTAVDLHYLENSTCGFEGSLPRLCCPYDAVQITEDRSATSLVGDGDEIGEHTVDVSTSPKLSLLPLSTCGPLGNDLIRNRHGGLSPWILQFSYLALLGYRNESLPADNHTDFYCEGTLISDRYVLTSASCVTIRRDKNLTLVRLGEVNRDETECIKVGTKKFCPPPVDDYFIEEITVHPNYNKRDKYPINDIALLRLNQTVEFKGHIRPICLPIGSEQTKQFSADSILVTSGWGTTRDGNRSPYPVFTTLSIPSYKSCALAYSKIGISTLPSRHICAERSECPTSYPCSTKSGAPLTDNGFVNRKERVVQYGIASFGLELFRTNFPDVFTKVGFYMDWILDTMRE